VTKPAQNDHLQHFQEELKGKEEEKLEVLHSTNLDNRRKEIKELFKQYVKFVERVPGYYRDQYLACKNEPLMCPIT